MSIAANFRRKWSALASAADASKGENDDARYSAMQQAADREGLILTEKTVINAYQVHCKKLTQIVNDAHHLLCWNYQHHIILDPSEWPKSGLRVWHLSDDITEHITAVEADLYSALMKTKPD